MVFIDGGVHNLDMIRAFTGANAVEVYAKAWNFDAGDNWGGGTAAFAQMQMDNGTKAFLEYSFGGAYTYNSWTHEYFRAECDKASIELDNRRITARTMNGFPVPEVSEIPLLQGQHWKHDLIVRRFIQWLDGGSAPDISIDESIHSMGMLFAVVESSRTGKPVKVKEFMSEFDL
jgi:predicted dehydrogenase